MSIERAVVQQAGTFVLRERFGSLLDEESAKGCSPILSQEPVCLEPAFRDLTGRQLATARLPPRSPRATSSEETVRGEVFVSREHSSAWQRSERFLKLLRTIRQPIAIEIVGNERKVALQIACDRCDYTLVSSAFRGEFEHCRLGLLERTALDGASEEDWRRLALRDYFPEPPYFDLFTFPEEVVTTPYEPLFVALSELPGSAIGFVQTLLQPVSDASDWRRNIRLLYDLRFRSQLIGSSDVFPGALQQVPSEALLRAADALAQKAHNDKPLFAAALRVGVLDREGDSRYHIGPLDASAGLYFHGGRPLQFLTETDYSHLGPTGMRDMIVERRCYRSGFLLNSLELATIAHVPGLAFAESRRIPAGFLEDLPADDPELRDGTPIGFQEFAGQKNRVCIPTSERRRHTHIIGRPGMGKSTLLERMILDDIRRGHGVAVFDPHNDLVERILSVVGEEAVERVVYFDPADPQWIPAWNPLRVDPDQDRHRTAENLVSAFKKVVTGWGDRMEHLLNVTLTSLLHLEGATLLRASELLSTDPKEKSPDRAELAEAVENPLAKRFWEKDYRGYSKQDRGPPIHKLGKLLVGGSVSWMLSQPESRIDLEEIMRDRKILLISLAGLGPEARQVLGSILLSLFHMAALKRSKIDERKRTPFHIYCDEAHQFVTDTIEDLVTDTRKYNVSLTFAHQFLDQFEKAAWSCLDSSGSTIIFNVARKDATYLARSLRENVRDEDIIALNPYRAISRIGTRNVRINMLEPVKTNSPNYRDRIVERSRELYYRPIDEVKRAVLGESTERGEPARTLPRRREEEFDGCDFQYGEL